MDVIAKITCEDCGSFIVSATNRVSLFVMNVKGRGMTISLITTCQFCEQPIIEDISVELAKKLAEMDVPVFSWHDGQKHEKVSSE
jgi:hypothetical protein